jgi:hypothetical protein
MSYEAIHWSIVNVMARVFGLMAALATVASGTTAVLQFASAPLTTPGMGALGHGVVSLFCLAIAVAFLTVRPYRPDVRKRLAAGDTSLPELSWWTGSPKD